MSDKTPRGVDYCGHDGAIRMATATREYWRKEGVKIRTKVVLYGQAGWGVRSNISFVGVEMFVGDRAVLG